MTTKQILDVFLPLFGVLLVGVLVPLYLVKSANNERRDDNERSDQRHREDRQADWDRQDAVAAKAAKAAEDLSVSQKKIADQAAVAARLLLANNERVATNQLETNGRLDVIHGLVNSTLSAAMQSEYDATKRELAMMREVMALKQSAGLSPTSETIAAITATETRLAELEQILIDRKATQDKINHLEDNRSEA
jgi:hypothetical protein